MILLQEGLWKYVEDVEDVDSSSTNVESMGRVTTTTHQPISNSDEQRYKVRRIIISTFQDDILLSVVSMTDPNQIWLGLKNVCDVQSSSRRLALKEEFFSLWLLEGKKNDNKPQSKDQYFEDFKNSKTWNDNPCDSKLIIGWDNSQSNPKAEIFLRNNQLKVQDAFGKN